MSLNLQTKLIDTLTTSGIPGEGEVLQVRETHISWILLTARHAYKIKKSVNLGFVNFSTLEKRRFYCEEELRLNRRFAPQLYLGLVEITGDAQAPSIGRVGEALEYAVLMRRFSPEDEMIHRIRKGEINVEQVREFASDLAAVHCRTHQSPVDSTYGTPQALEERTRTNFEAIAAGVDDAEILQRLSLIQTWTKSSLNSLDAVFRGRRKEGRIRECHGDLHLGNLVVLNRRITAFDCLEFNADFRWIDCASDVAFLIMDLRANRYLREARVFLNAYLEASGDYKLVSVLKHYLVYRAMVRAKVVCLRAAQQRSSANRDPDLHRYLDFAEDVIRRSSSSGIIITHGYSGSGKTWLCRRLLATVDVIHLRSDIVRRTAAFADSNKTTGGADRGDNNRYSSARRMEVYRSMLKTAETIVAAGFTVLVDATFLKAETRALFYRLSRQTDVSFHILDLVAPEDVLSSRIASRMREGRDASDADINVLRRQLRDAEELSDDERVYAVSVNTAAEQDECGINALAHRLQLRPDTSPS